MPQRWAADIVAQLFMHGIEAQELAKKIGWHPKYLSVVLNGHRTPKGAEQKIVNALNKLIIEKQFDFKENEPKKLKDDENNGGG